MNIGALKEIVAAYLQVAQSSLVVNGQDLILASLNNARRKAELVHDWQCEEVTAYGTATAGVGNWKTMLDTADDSSVNMKKPTNFFINENGLLIPLLLNTRKSGVSRAKEYLYRRAGVWGSRYNGDVTELSGFSNGVQTSPGLPRVFTFGNGKYRLEPVPTSNTVTIQVDGHRWLPDYTDDTDEDFFTTEGAEYMQWAAIVELNMRTQTFIPQQEGNLAPPEKAKEQSLAALVAHDVYASEGDIDIVR